MGAGNIIAAVVVVGAIVGTYAIARTLDHIDEAIDAWGDQPVIHDEMKVAAPEQKHGGGGARHQAPSAAVSHDIAHRNQATSR